MRKFLQKEIVRDCIHAAIFAVIFVGSILYMLPEVPA